MRWSTLPVAAQVRAIFPVLAGISGSTSTMFSILSSAFLSTGYFRPKSRELQLVFPSLCNLSDISNRRGQKDGHFCEYYRKIIPRGGAFSGSGRAFSEKNL